MLGPLSAFLSSLTWSIGSVQYSAIARHHSIYALNFTRALVALPLFVLATFVWSGGWSEGLAAFSAANSQNLFWMTASMISSYALGDLCFFMSARRVGVPTALAIASAYPVWTLAYSALVGDDPIRPLQALGVLVVVAGIVAVILQAPVHAGTGEVHEGSRKGALRVGWVLATLTSLFWALNSFAVAEGGQGILPTVGNSIRMAVALVLTFGLRLAFDRSGAWRLPLATLRPKLWVFVLEAFGGSLFFVYGLAHSPLFLGTTLSALAPALSVPVAILFGVERFHAGRFLAILAVLLGVLAILSPA